MSVRRETHPAKHTALAGTAPGSTCSCFCMTTHL
jgi:hypothetical protein